MKCCFSYLLFISLSIHLLCCFQIDPKNVFSLKFYFGNWKRFAVMKRFHRNFHKIFEVHFVDKSEFKWKIYQCWIEKRSQLDISTIVISTSRELHNQHIPQSVDTACLWIKHMRRQLETKYQQDKVNNATYSVCINVVPWAPKKVPWIPKDIPWSLFCANTIQYLSGILTLTTRMRDSYCCSCSCSYQITRTTTRMWTDALHYALSNEN